MAGGTSPNLKTDAVISRVEHLLLEIIGGSNHGEIGITIVAGRIYVSGGQTIEIK